MSERSVAESHSDQQAQLNPTLTHFYPRIRYFSEREKGPLGTSRPALPPTEYPLVPTDMLA